MVYELDVWLLSHRVGTLAPNRGRLQFQYSAEWLRRPDAVALSCSLPLQAEIFDDAQVRPFFAGTWRIIEMEMWDRDYCDIEVPAHITIAKLPRSHGRRGTWVKRLTKAGLLEEAEA